MGRDTALVERAARAWDVAQQGDFRELIRLGPALAGALDPEARAYARLIDVVRGLVEPEPAPPPAPEALAPDARGADTSVSSEALAHAALVAWLRLDARLAHAYGAVHERLAITSDRAGAFRDLGRAIRATLAGDAALAHELARSLAADGARLGVGSLVIMGSTIDALAALAMHDTGAALGAARRASRMARTEGMLVPEYLANLVLARVRRFGGVPYLAQRILEALGQVVPAAWRIWLEWELYLSGTQTSPAHAPAVKAIVDAAESGDRPRFDAAASRASEASLALAPFEVDASNLVAALDLDARGVTAWIAAWREGRVSQLPFVLADSVVEASEPVTEQRAQAFVCAIPDRPSVRVLRAGLPLLAPYEMAVLPESGRPQLRVHGLLSSVALAGPDGADEGAAFERVWEFPFVRDKHVGVLKNVVHRARAELGTLGELVRDNGRLRLVPWRPLAIADPLCQPTLGEHILRALSRQRGTASARMVADALGVSPRLVQQVLRDLIDSGACAIQRDGRAISYCLEDTTFFEPTLDRLRPRV